MFNLRLFEIVLFLTSTASGSPFVPPKQFFDSITSIYKDNRGPVIIIGGTKEERLSLADSYADQYFNEISEYMLWINCTSNKVMSNGFYAIAEAYNFTDAMEKRNIYDLIDTVLKHFLPWKTLFVLEEADINNKFLQNFFEMAKHSNKTHILVTNAKETKPNKKFNYSIQSALDFEALENILEQYNNSDSYNNNTYAILYEIIREALDEIEAFNSEEENNNSQEEIFDLDATEM